MFSRKSCSASIFTAFKYDWNSLRTACIEYEYVYRKFTYSPWHYPSIDLAKKSSVGPISKFAYQLSLNKNKNNNVGSGWMPAHFYASSKARAPQIVVGKLQQVQRFKGRFMFSTLSSKRSDRPSDLKWVKRQGFNAFCNINNVCSASRSCGIILEHFKTRVNIPKCSVFLNWLLHVGLLHIISRFCPLVLFMGF